VKGEAQGFGDMKFHVAADGPELRRRNVNLSVNSNSWRLFFSKWRSLRLSALEVTFPSDTLTRRVSTMPRVR
jgi:hypothetical protein